MLSVALALAALADPSLVYGNPIAYHNMTVVPVTTTATGPFQQYTLLEDGIAKKTLAIRELNGNDGSASVNELEVKNTGRDPVFLLSGEMVMGGKQDRILQSDAVIPPDGKWMHVPVFCVEHGRWTGAKMDFASGGAIAHRELATAALSGDQGAVWAEVAKTNAKEGTESATGTYRRTVQDGALRDKIAKHRDALKKELPKGRLAGFVFAVNGDVRIADLFGNPVLLDELQDKLLSAYILEALEEDVDPNAKPLSPKAAEAFIESAQAAPVSATKSAGRAENTTRENDEVIMNQSKDTATGVGTRGTYMKKKKK